MGAGQFRVPDDRQFRISSARLQLVERSQVSNRFTGGYHTGIFWSGEWVPPDGPGIKLYASVTRKKAGDLTKGLPGQRYTGRFEFLPLGGFRNGSDYCDGTLNLQPGPKLSVGLATSLNAHSEITYPVTGERSRVDVRSLFADLLFKYRHFSLFGEWAWRDVTPGITGRQAGSGLQYAPVSGTRFSGVPGMNTGTVLGLPTTCWDST